MCVQMRVECTSDLMCLREIMGGSHFFKKIYVGSYIVNLFVVFLALLLIFVG